MLWQIAAPMPRVPPVTSATRPSSLRGPVPAAGGACVWVALMCVSPPLAIGALVEPLRDVRPDLVARLRPRHQADVPAGAGGVRDVLARQEVEQGQRARARGDVVAPRRDDQQVLVD